ncbi:GNAT family N-acetyltransferase [Halorussus aquaticus]|uniref:GNAT family N-acetyltransferase n=1 Tax=Halorussus aquaticus TaxID=2953748 RepID=A0ABD5PZV5_9EURY|nr:GNAT family N-acetyltransferase [Halorussus aquaticus]
MGQREADSDGIEIREAESGDGDGIRDVALESLHASYGDILDEDVIETATENWYADEMMEAELEEEGMLYLVAVAGDEVVGFSQNLLAEGDATILWLHVDPDNRDKNVGTTLLNQTLATLSERGVERIAAEVLTENEAGCTFYEANGFEKAGERERDIGDETHVENLYVHEGRAKLETREFEGRSLYVNWAESRRGSHAPFYEAYTDEEGEDLYGWFCSNCQSFDIAMDSMERLECNDCGNQKKPTRWDASYL